jgi:hypothetical protein
MNLFPYKKNSQRIGSSVSGVALSRGFIARFQVSSADAVAQSITGILGVTPLTAQTQSIIAGISNPAVPRNVKIKANAAGVAGNVVITGTNYQGLEISETLALNGTTEVLGNKAFKSVTRIDLPIETHAGTDTVSVGFSNKLGIPYKLSLDTVLVAYREGVKEGTAPTVTVSPTNIEDNTVLLNSALNGTQIDVILVV